MSTGRHICICAAQVPFVRGGAEALVESLRRELASRGHVVEVVALPYKWYPHEQVLRSCLAWRLVDLDESNGVKVDTVIATKFPSYVVAHPRKVTWLVHQFRQVYDLYGTPYSDFAATPADNDIREAIVRIDNRSLAESGRLFSISRNTAERLAKFNHLHAETLYHPPPLEGRYFSAEQGPYVLSVGRLEDVKRVDLLLRAMARVRAPLRAVVAGTGPNLDPLRRLATELGIAERVDFRGRVSDEDLLGLYANCLAVFYAPFDEDYGYVTLEAFRSGKPVITCADAGGVLEFVEHRVTGLVSKSLEPDDIASLTDWLWENRGRAREMGRAALDSIEHITWDATIEALLG